MLLNLNTFFSELNKGEETLQKNAYQSLSVQEQIHTFINGKNPTLFTEYIHFIEMISANAGFYLSFILLFEYPIPKLSNHFQLRSPEKVIGMPYSTRLFDHYTK